MTFEQLHADILQTKTVNPSPSVQMLCGYLLEILRFMSPQENTECLHNEITALHQQIDKLTAENLSLNSNANAAARIINALRDVLRIPGDQPSTQLVPLATSIMKQLDDLKKGHP